MRILRLGYVVPRLIALALVYLLVEVGSGYLLRWSVESGGSAAIGAKVDLAGARVSLLDTQLRLDGLAITNPSSPMRNLAEVARIDADLHTAALLRGKVVVNYGVVSGLKFDTDRATSGALPDTNHETGSEPSWLSRQAHSAATWWFEELEERLENDLHSQLRSVALAKELEAKWKTRREHLEQQIREFHGEAQRLEEAWKTAKKNPLRHGEFLARIPQETTNLRRTLREMQTQLAALPDELKADKRAIEEAKAYDRQRIAQLADVEGIDPQALADYLIGEQVTGTLSEAIGWMRFARKLVPPSADQTTTAELAGRGTNVVFDGGQPLPDVWVKLLRLEGSARLGGQPLEIVGTLHDWSTQSHRIEKPTTLELRTSGGLPLTLQASFNRLGDTPRDDYTIRAHGLAIPGGNVGKQGKVQFTISGSTADVLATFRLEGENLSGRLVITQQGLGVKPEIALAHLGQPLEQALATRLGNLRQGETEVTLAGTLTAPQIAIRSTVATALAEAITGSAAEVTNQIAQDLIARGQQEVDTHLARLETDLNQFRAKMEGELTGPGELVAQLLGQRGDGTPQLGGLLPPGSLFK